MSKVSDYVATVRYRNHMDSDEGGGSGPGVNTREGGSGPGVTREGGSGPGVNTREGGSGAPAREVGTSVLRPRAPIGEPWEGGDTAGGANSCCSSTLRRASASSAALSLAASRIRSSGRRRATAAALALRSSSCCCSCAQGSPAVCITKGARTTVQTLHAKTTRKRSVKPLLDMMISLRIHQPSCGDDV